MSKRDNDNVVIRFRRKPTPIKNTLFTVSLCLNIFAGLVSYGYLAGYLNGAIFTPVQQVAQVEENDNLYVPLKTARK